MDACGDALGAALAETAMTTMGNSNGDVGLVGNVGMRLSKPGGKGNTLSMATEWELMCAMMHKEKQSVQAFADDNLQTDNLGDDN